MSEKRSQTLWNPAVRPDHATGLDEGEPTVLIGGPDSPPTNLRDVDSPPTELHFPDSPPTELHLGDAPPAASPRHEAADPLQGLTRAADLRTPAGGARRTAPPPRIGPMRWLRWYLSSGVGRRLMIMFVLTSLLPVTLLAGLSFAYVSQVLRSVIVDFARRRSAERRGGGPSRSIMERTRRGTSRECPPRTRKNY